MNTEHVISDEVLDKMQADIARGIHWFAYNTVNYFQDAGSVYSFRHEDEAHEFSSNNISEYDNYRVFHALSVKDILEQFSYGELLENLLVNQKSVSAMNEKNFEYLSNQLKFTGFGEELKEQLKAKMEKNEPQFTLTFQKDYGKDETVSTLQFRKSDESDMYFFNRYNLMLKDEQHPDAIKQTFFINPMDESITLKEAYNLLSGRAIHKEMTPKEGEKYNAWLQLDFKDSDANGNFKVKQYHENYGYNLQETLNKHPIKELQNEQEAKRLIESLERGNRQSVTLDINGKEQKVAIEAVPQFKSLNFYDGSNQRLRSDKLYESNSTEKSVKEDKKQSAKQSAAGEEGEPEPGAKKAKRKGQRIS